MKKTGFFLFSIVLTSLIIFSCSKSSDTTTYVGNWSQIGNLMGAGRSGAVCFTIGDTVYIGLGYNQYHYVQSVDQRYPRDFYKYVPKDNQFQLIDSFPGIGRTLAVAFSVNGRGYVGTGWDGVNEKYLNDFYEYDPATTPHWKKVADMGTSITGPRRGAVAFAIGANGYVGTGYNDNYLQDFWKFTPDGGLGNWTETTGLPFKRAYAASFVIQNRGYIVTGDNNGTYTDLFYRFNPDSATWTKLRRIANVDANQSYDDNYNIIRSYASGFASSSKGYITCGSYGGNRTDTWEYDYVNDVWTQKTSFEGTSRTQAIGFSVKDRLFVGTGASGSNFYDDIWEFKPNDTYDQYN